MDYRYKINDTYKDLEQSLIDIENFFNQVDTNIHQARNELKIIQLKKISTIVKSFKIPNFLNKIVYTYFKDSKAKKSYNNSLKIGEFTPAPIGYIEFYSTALLNKSYFISERFNYDFTIREPLLDSSFTKREEILKAFARFTLELHNNNIFHNDYSPGNILIKKENDTFIFKIVDINRMHFFKLQEDDRAKNFSKLWADDRDLELMATEYKNHYNTSSSFTEKVLHYSNQNKKIKNFKKKLKGKPVND